MRINDQLFVEFSGTGNACYTYSDKHNRVPFNPQADALHTNLDLKHIQADPYRRQSDNRILHSGSWKEKANLFLADRGIRSGAARAIAHEPVQSYQPRFRPAAPSAPAASRQAAVPSASPSVSSEVRRAIRQASELARINGAGVEDNLQKGGYFWVLAPDPGPVLNRELIRLGLNFQQGKGFWIK